MCAPFTDDDVGKRVETADGEPLGTVRMTDAETAYVDANDGATSAIRAILESDANGGDVVPLDEDAVSEVTGDVIRLAVDRSSLDESTDGTDPVIERDERTERRDDSDEQRTQGPQPGAPGDPAESEEGRTGQGLEPSTEEMTEAGEERHPEMEDAPPEGDRTVTTERGEKEDR